MAGVTCPQCHAPMTQAEYAGDCCPLCGSSLHVDASTSAPPMPSPAVTRLALELAKPRRRKFPASLFILLLLLVNGVIWCVFVMSKPKGASQAGAAGPPPSTVTAPPASSGDTNDPDTTTPVIPGEGPASTAAASTPVAAEANGLDIPVLPDLPAAVVEQTEGDDLILYRPANDYAVRRLVAGEHVKLRGKVKVLRIATVNGKSTLDASKLEVETVSIYGYIHGQSVVKVSAPGGRVALRCTVDGLSTLEIDAPDGEVEFMTPKTDAAGGSAINGDSQIIITGKDVKLPASIDGAKTRILVTLTKGGSLTFGELKGQVRLHYRKTDAGDPEPTIKAGKVNGEAEFKRID